MPTRVEYPREEFRQGGHVFPENPELDALMRQLETSVSYARFGADLTPAISGEYDCGTVAKPWRGMNTRAVECIGTSTFRQGVMQIREKGVLDFGTNTSLVVLPVYTEGTSPFDLWHESSEYLRDGACWLQKGSPARLMLRGHGVDRMVSIYDTTTNSLWGSAMLVRNEANQVTFSSHQFPDDWGSLGIEVGGTCTFSASINVVSGIYTIADDGSWSKIFSSNQASNRDAEIPALSQNSTFAFLEEAQEWTGAQTFSSIIMTNGGTIGQAAGPLMTFDDTNNRLGLSGGDFRITSGNLEIHGGAGNGIYGDVTSYTYYEIAQVDYHHHFLTRTNAGASLERFTIEGGAVTGNVYFQNCNVGIGTSAPGSLLHIKGADAAVTLEDSGGNDWDMQVHSGSLEFGEGGVANNRLVLLNGGNVGIGITPSYKFSIGSTDGSDQVGIYHDNTNAIFTTTDGVFRFVTDEGTNTATTIQSLGKGTGVGYFRAFDEDNLESLEMSCASGVGTLRTIGSSPSYLSLQDTAHAGVYCFLNAVSGETPELRVYGYRAADALRSLQIGTGVDAADTASFDGLSNYAFDGNLVVGKLAAASVTGLEIFGSSATDSIQIYHNESNAYFRTDDGSFIFLTDEGTNTSSYLTVYGKGTGRGYFLAYDEDNAEHLEITCSGGIGIVRTSGSSPSDLRLQDTAHADVTMFVNAASGETPDLQISGYRTGDAKRTATFGVSSTANDTFNIAGVSNYVFDGDVEAPTAHFGDATDYSEFEADGTLKFNGAATVWEDLRVPATALKAGASTYLPSWAQFKDDGSGSRGVYLWWFSASTENEVFFAVQLPHEWKEGTAIHPHVHWVPETDDEGTVEWFLEYTVANIAGTYGNTTVISATETISNNAGDHVLTDLGDITMSGKTISCMIVCRLYRDGGAGNDDYAATAGLLEIDFHYEIDTAGSRQELVK